MAKKCTCVLLRTTMQLQAQRVRQKLRVDLASLPTYAFLNPLERHKAAWVPTCTRYTLHNCLQLPPCRGHATLNCLRQERRNDRVWFLTHFAEACVAEYTQQFLVACADGQ
ncbi:unnamed protein product [Ectocarpus fasciculatus]